MSCSSSPKAMNARSRTNPNRTCKDGRRSRIDAMKDEERMNPGESLSAALTLRLLLTLTAGLALASPPAFAQTPKDTVVMAKQIDDIISLDPAEAFEFSGSEAVANIY